VPLSEHEQHLLEQMEQALYAEDPKFASQMQGSAARARFRRSLVFGAGGVVAGLGFVVLGVATESVLWGAVGFALMVSGVAYAIKPPKTLAVKLGAVAQDGTVREHEPAGRFEKWRRTAKPRQAGKPQAGKKPNAPKQTFLRRLEDRWDRRRQEGQ